MRGLDASDRGTRLKIVEYVPVESKAASFHKVPHEDYTNHLVKQKALIASEIETTSSSLLIQTLQGKKNPINRDNLH